MPGLFATAYFYGFWPASTAERGAPGSVDDVKKAEAAWWLLRRAAETALEFCQKADEQELPPGGGMR